MSVGARGVFTTPYAPLLFEVARLLFPAAGREEATFAALAAACRAEPVAALIVEPLILGAGGMLTYTAAALAEMARIARGAGAPHRRRGDDRLGPHGHAVRVRAGRHHAGHALHGEGPHRGALPLAATLCRARDLPGAPFAGPHAHVLPLRALHGEPDRVRRRRSPTSRCGSASRLGSASRRSPRRRPSASRGSAATHSFPTCAARHHDRARSGRWATPATSPRSGRVHGVLSPAACCCALGSTTTFCRPIASRLPSLTSSIR